jgi:hypothetical protein
LAGRLLNQLDSPGFAWRTTNLPLGGKSIKQEKDRIKKKKKGDGKGKEGVSEENGTRLDFTKIEGEKGKADFQNLDLLLPKHPDLPF